jgi:hypothetical protein
MSISTKDAWLEGPTDLAEAVVEDVPVKGQSVRVRALPAQFSNEAQSKALKMVTGSRGEQTAMVDVAAMAKLQFEHGVIEPKFTAAEVSKIAERYGPAFHKVVEKIDELSGVDKEAIEEASARFQDGVEGEGHAGETEPAPPAAADSGPAVPGGTGA